MSVETMTYAELGVRLTISPKAARSLAKRLRLPRLRSNDGRALVSVDLAEIRHKPRPPGRRKAGKVVLTEKIEALQAQIVQLEAIAAAHRAEFERERDRADRLTVELLQAAAETMAAKEATARLQRSLRRGTAGSIDSHGLATRRLGNLAADLVAADRKASK